MRTERDLAREAMDVQNACNLSGVVASFKLALIDLWMIARDKGEGTDWVNNHPVSVAYASKIESLTKCHQDDVLEGALDAMEALLNPTTAIVMNESITCHKE